MPSVLFLGRKQWGAQDDPASADSGWDVRGVVARDPTHEFDAHLGSVAGVAHEIGAEIMTPEEFHDRLERDSRSLEVDVVFSYLYWLRVRPDALRLARLAAINFHPAPLPELRGLAGYNVAILEDHPEYGVSAHHMAETIDTGDIIAVRRFPIDRNSETAMTLERRSMEHLLELFRTVADLLTEGRPLPRVPQGEGRYFDRRRFEELRKANIDEPAEQLARRCRAFFFPPQAGAYVEVGGKEFTLVTDEILQDIDRRLTRGALGLLVGCLGA